MNRTGRTLLTGCLLSLLTSPVWADNSLLIRSTERCTLGAAEQYREQAISACEQLAEGGDDQAQLELGEFFYSGPDDQRDLNRALHWFEQASLRGNADAQLRLGTMFYRGEGVPANNVQAYIVLKMAAVNGSDQAMDSADEVSEKMAREEQQAASQVLGQIFRHYLLEIQNAPPESAPSTKPGLNLTPSAP